MTKEIKFLGLLANVDSTILNLKLQHNFKTKSIEVEEGVNLLSELENLPKMEVFGKFSAGYNCIDHDEKRIYYLDNSFN